MCLVNLRRSSHSSMMMFFSVRFGAGKDELSATRPFPHHRDSTDGAGADGYLLSVIIWQWQKNNGITRSEIAEILTHAAFYAGWPKAWAAFRMAKDSLGRRAKAADAKATSSKRVWYFPSERPMTVSHSISAGRAILRRFPRHRSAYYNVTFEPGCRNNWHIHEADKGRRTDPCLRGWARLLSGMGQRAAGAAPRRCDQHYARCQALARRCAGQLVFPSGCGSTWRKLPQSVV